jgi:2-succinyl-5-enolpyruvyl-6-hydroxy-3-cyclohexene-1-carboxylate synthase
MMPRPANRNYAFSEAFVDELARSGLRHVCICPGSRSTPLVMSLAQRPRIKVWVHLDERSAAYFALGMSRTLDEPVAVISTSGTAAANFFPAVVEAHYSHAPILIVTADRPPELWEWGANQTIDQSRMYGGHAKWSLNMASPEVTLDLLRYVREMACRALSTAVQSPAGPVHINFPFGEPLVPENVPDDIPEHIFAGTQDAWDGRKQGRAYTDVQNGRRSVSREKVKELAGDIRTVRNGIIVCGPQDDPDFPLAVSMLANRLCFPILADSLSQVRCGTHDQGLVVDCYDAFLRSEKLVQALEPEIILRFGATPTSKVLQSYLERHHQARQIVIQEGDWQDPMHVASDMFQTDPDQFARELAGAAATTSYREWSGRWLAVAEMTREAIRDQMSDVEEMFEGKIFTELAALLPPRATLFAGNSMPVRDLDAFYPSTSQRIRFLANRGASGIDGVVSTALGASAVTREPTVLVVGDISFYHDMNGLLAAKQYNLNATIVLANNNGGGIFSFLPQLEYKESFEKYFATPHGLTFHAAASLYGLTYSKAVSWEEFHTAVSQSVGSSGTAIVEMQTNRDRNVELHRRIWSTVTEAAENTLTERT